MPFLFFLLLVFLLDFCLRRLDGFLTVYLLGIVLVPDIFIFDILLIKVCYIFRNELKSILHTMNLRRKKYIQKALKTLLPLTKISNKQREHLIPLLSDDCIHKICESCQNLLMNTFQLDNKKLSNVKKRLKKSQKDIRCLAKPKTSLLRKRQLLSNEQTGRGIFTILASTIVPALIAALTKR